MQYTSESVVREEISSVKESLTKEVTAKFAYILNCLVLQKEYSIKQIRPVTIRNAKHKLNGF